MRLKKIVLRLLAVLLIFNVSFAYAKEQVIGVLALKGEVHAYRTWSPMIDYLNKEIELFTFRLLPLGFSEVATAVSHKKIDYLITNPAMFVREEITHRVTSLATLQKNLHEPNDLVKASEFGGVIFFRKNIDIEEVIKLFHERIGAVAQFSFGGYLVQKFELFNSRNIQLNDRRVNFFNNHYAVVNAVLAGDIDVGFVRTGVLEEMGVQERFSVLAPTVDHVFPYELSTELYPEWPFIALDHVDMSDSKLILSKLLQWEGEDTRGNLLAWGPSLNYFGIQELLKKLRIEPFDQMPQLTFSEWFFNFEKWAFFLIATILGMIMVLAFLTRRSFSDRVDGSVLRKKLQAQGFRINELEQYSKEIVHLEARFRVLMDAVREGLVLFELNGEIVLMNPQAQRLLSNYPNDGFIQDDFFMFLEPHHQKTLHERLKKISLSHESSSRYVVGFEQRSPISNVQQWFEVYVVMGQEEMKILIVITELEESKH
jgi:PAS domain-containing protein